MKVRSDSKRRKHITKLTNQIYTKKEVYGNGWLKVRINIIQIYSLNGGMIIRFSIGNAI